MKKSQKEIVIDYLKTNKHINPVEAFNMNMLRLSAIIYDLKADGWNIDGDFLYNKITKKHDPYKTYFLKKPYKLF